MAKPFLIGTVATMLFSATIGLALYAFDASGEVGGIAFILVACVAGVIGAEIARHLPPAKRQR